MPELSEHLLFIFVYRQYADLFLVIFLLCGGDIQFFKHKRIWSVPSKQETLTQGLCKAGLASQKMG